MALGLFSESKRSVAARLQASDWKDLAERKHLLGQFQADRPKPPDLAFLLSHSDSDCRQLGFNLARANAGAAMLEVILKDAEKRTELSRRMLVKLALTQGRKEIICAIEARLSSDASPQRQALALQLVQELPRHERVAFVERALDSELSQIRELALERYLQDLGSGDEPPPRLLALVKDENEAIRVKVIRALARFKSPHVLTTMVDRFVHDTAGVRAAAQEYLREAMTSRAEEIRERLVPLIAGTDPQLRKGALDLLASCVPPEEALRLVMEHVKDSPGWVRSRATETLRQLGEALVVPLCRLLGHPDAEVRAASLGLAEGLKDPRLVPPLAHLLSDPDWCTRMIAAELLGATGQRSAIEPLLQAIQDPECRWAAVDALAAIGDASVISKLMPLLADKDPATRIEVLDALARFAEPSLVYLFERLAQDANPDVGRKAKECQRAFVKRFNLSLPEDVGGAEPADLSRPIDQLLAKAREMGASDVHVMAGERPWIRVAGRVAPLEGAAVLDASATRDWLMRLLDDGRRARFAEKGEIDFCYEIDGVGRHRCNVYRQRSGICGAFRLIPLVPPTLEELQLPTQLREILDYHQGLIVVGGPAGSGKSTTMAALLDLINEQKSQHIVTIEDPIEFLHPIKSSIVNQREAGRHTASFARALRAALREDPDVISIGEMRDIETIRLALSAAETGHVVLATMHTVGAAEAVNSIIDAFPPDEQAQVRTTLYESLRYVVCQHLLPRADGQGRVAAFEILKGTLPVGNLIREGQTHQLRSLMQIGRSSGMQLLDQAVQELLDKELISAETAEPYLAPSSRNDPETNNERKRDGEESP
jgi:twitching motility protein PilT